MIGVFDGLGATRQSADATRTVTQAEQQEAAGWAKTDTGRRLRRHGSRAELLARHAAT
ncbi:MAG: hypothetical protein ACRDJ9_06040 [Dehalococcoidia bacterium]